MDKNLAASSDLIVSDRLSLVLMKYDCNRINFAKKSPKAIFNNRLVNCTIVDYTVEIKEIK